MAGGRAHIIEVLIAPYWVIAVAEGKNGLVRSLHYYCDHIATYN